MKSNISIMNSDTWSIVMSFFGENERLGFARVDKYLYKCVFNEITSSAIIGAFGTDTRLYPTKNEIKNATTSKYLRQALGSDNVPIAKFVYCLTHPNIVKNIFCDYNEQSYYNKLNVLKWLIQLDVLNKYKFNSIFDKASCQNNLPIVKWICNMDPLPTTHSMDYIYEKLWTNNNFSESEHISNTVWFNHIQPTEKISHIEILGKILTGKHDTKTTISLALYFCSMYKSKINEFYYYHYGGLWRNYKLTEAKFVNSLNIPFIFLKSCHNWYTEYRYKGYTEYRDENTNSNKHLNMHLNMTLNSLLMDNQCSIQIIKEFYNIHQTVQVEHNAICYICKYNIVDKFIWALNLIKPKEIYSDYTNDKNYYQVLFELASVNNSIDIVKIIAMKYIDDKITVSIPFFRHLCNSRFFTLAKWIAGHDTSHCNMMINYMTETNDMDGIKEILQHATKYHGKGKMMAFTNACKFGSDNVAKFLHNATNINQTDIEKTPAAINFIYYACEKENIDFAKWLYSIGCPVNSNLAKILQSTKNVALGSWIAEILSQPKPVN